MSRTLVYVAITPTKIWVLWWHHLLSFLLGQLLDQECMKEHQTLVENMGSLRVSSYDSSMACRLRQAILNIDWEIAWHPPPDSIIVHSEKFGRKDISRENKKSTPLFCWNTTIIWNYLQEMMLSAQEGWKYHEHRYASVYILTKLSAVDMLIFREMA